MISGILKENFPFAAKYFETLIKDEVKRFPQAIVFEGLDIVGQYMFSTELARILNCKENGEENCNCINCSWIREGKHPSINTVSPINYKEDASRTVISIGQAKKITASLRETSDYHRFFIFCDAKIKQPSAQEEHFIKKYENLGFSFPESGWVPGSLNMKIFKTEASNSLLKSIEEPPPRTTFVFLTKNKEDLISTIVSRSNVFKLASGTVRIKAQSLPETFVNYPNFTIQEALEGVSEIESAIKTDGADIFDILDGFQEHILDTLKQNAHNKGAFNKLSEDIKLVQKAKNRLRVSMSPRVVLESLLLDLAKGK